jgi:ATP-binding cassette subfamily C protein
MKGILHIFFNSAGAKPWPVLGCLVLAGIAEAIGLTTLLPVLGRLTGESGAQSSTLGVMGTELIAYTGIDPSTGNLILLIVALLCAKSALTFAALAYVGYTATEVQTAMRIRLISNLLDARWSYFTANRVGTIANAISNDAARVNTTFITAGKFVAYILQTAVYISIALLVSWRLALLGVALGAGVSFLMGGLVTMSRRAGNLQTDSTSRLTTYVSDAFNNIKPIRTMNRGTGYAAQFERRLKSLKKALRIQALARQGMLRGKELLTLVMIGAGAYTAIVVWHMPLSELIVFGAVFLQVVSIIGKAQANLQRAVELESAYWRLQALIDDAHAQAEPSRGTKTPQLTHLCRFENVSFAYDDKPVVTNISLDIPAREITVLQGPSGAGKTTLIDLLTGLYEPGSGRILIDDTPLTEIHLRQWRRLIGYVPQELSLIHDTVHQNITMGDTSITEAEVKDALKLAGAHDFVQSLPEGIRTMVGERGLRLSGGERQRIALARALVVKPKLLILDEVTSALDPATERAICENITELAGAYTIVAITHRPAWAEIATNLYQVEGGMVSKADRPVEPQPVT